MSDIASSTRHSQDTSGPAERTSPDSRLVTELTRTSPYARHARSRTNFELWSWLFMRASGVLLIVLVFGHLFVNLMLGDGIEGIDFAFVAGKWASPFWQFWDLLMLWLAEIHGVNGVRTIINDYTERDSTRLVLKTLLFLAAVFTMVLGTMVIFTFDPCIDPNSTLAVCNR
ncbi:MAG TPA: succinate dehydrogenase hydrophobic membrane anchor subunit [Segeticoccus sp.]|nr:succinate dehydrogenase hydrophobic membrane anchor subunit [Segeticoccus sp.]